MGFQGGERAVSEVMGAILVFGILVTALGVYQAVVVPDVNEEVEFKHNAEVRGDMQDLWLAIVETGRTGERNTVQLTTGADYPTRVFTINPPPISGRLTTTASHSDTAVIEGAKATNEEANDYWSGGTNRAFSSRFVEYTPNYNYYPNAPTTIFEPTVLFSEDRGGTVVDSPQRLVDGDTINLVLVDGEYAKSNDRQLAIDAVPISASSQTVEIEPSSDGDPISLVVRTRLPESKWRDFAEKYDHVEIPEHDGYDSIDDAPNKVTLQLTAEKYTLNIAKIGINQDDTTSAAYIENTDSTARSLNPRENADLRVRVLDEYGNPVKGEDVYCCGPSAETTVETDEDGIATFEYNAGSNGGEVEDVEIWFGDESQPPSADDSPEKVSYTISVSDASPDGPGANILNPGSGLVLVSETVSDDTSTAVDVTFENTADDSGSIEVKELRVNYYFVNPPANTNSQNSRGEVESFTTDRTGDTTGNVGREYLNTDGSFKVQSGETKGINLEFSGPGFSNVQEGDYFFISLKFDDGSSRLYIVAPQE